MQVQNNLSIYAMIIQTRALLLKIIIYIARFVGYKVVGLLLASMSLYAFSKSRANYTVSMLAIIHTLKS